MKYYPDYLAREIKMITIDKISSKGKKYDTLTALKLLIYLLPLLLFALCQADSIKCEQCGNEIQVQLIPKEAQWRCKMCGKYNWSQNSDWKGDYYCVSCGTRKGDE